MFSDKLLFTIVKEAYITYKCLLTSPAEVRQKSSTDSNVPGYEDILIDDADKSGEKIEKI